MARLTQIPDTSADAETTAIFEAIRGKIGKVPNLYRVAANCPAVLRALLSANDSLSGGGFGARTREAIALAVAGRNGCDYCASAHSAIAAGLRIDAQTIAEHIAGRAQDQRLQAILTLAVAIVDARGRVADSDLDSARAAGLSDADIVETVGNVVVNIFTNYLNHIADTDIDFPVVTVAWAAQTDLSTVIGDRHLDLAHRWIRNRARLGSAAVLLRLTQPPLDLHRYLPAPEIARRTFEC